MSSTITEFWAAHPECWIPITQAQKAHADKLIYDTFYGYDYEGQNLPGRAIFLDQFQRHFQRHLGTITEEHITKCRELAAEDVERNADELICYRESDLVACLMPFKHLGRFTFIFDYLHNTWLPDMGWGPEGREAERVKAYPVLAKFYYDTFRKWQTDAVIAEGLFKVPRLGTYTYNSDICESNDNPPSLAFLRDKTNEPGFKEIVDTLRGVQSPVVSLSGGIDSMIALTILQVIGARPTAVHIIYGNRATSSDEFAFVAAYCKRLLVPLTMYEIPHIRREDVDRDFYESVTRYIRFAVYRQVAADKPVLLGHIRDDCIENIWTNFARGQHLDNLVKMEVKEQQLGVNLWRPFLGIQKSAIYAAAEQLHIPHLKNTTPSWCNRGKFREHFYAQTHAQYGPEVDAALLKVADTLKAQAALINRLLFQQIYDSWDAATATLNVEPALKTYGANSAEQSERQILDAASWLQIFEHVCHKYLKVNRPSIHAAHELVRRLKTYDNKFLKMNVGKGVSITLTGTKLLFEILS
jgi:tRNA(Ile)-lysidine synthetase-like protein